MSVWIGAGEPDAGETAESSWVNQNLPILPLYNNAFHEAYGTSRYTSFPPDTAKWLWTGLGGAAQPVVWQQAGYLQMNGQTR